MALRQEIERLTPALRRFSRALMARSGADRVEASDDLVHETLMRALKFEGPAQGVSVTTWIYALLIGINRQLVRAQQPVSHQNSGRALGQGDEVAALGLMRNNLSLSAGDDVTSSLQSLDLEAREVFLLVVLEGMSYAQAALVLGLPQATLLARLARSRARLSDISTTSAVRMTTMAQSHLRLVK